VREALKNPDTFPATAQDRFDYFIGLLSSDPQISMVLFFDEPLDPSLLEKAYEITLRLEPVLSCNFIDDEMPYWVKAEGDAMQCGFQYEECADSEVLRKAHDYITRPGDRKTAPMVHVKLFRSSRDVLCIRISHLCSDAGGLKEYAALLSSVYSRLEQSPDPKAAEGQILEEYRPGFRDQAPLFSALGITDLSTAIAFNQDDGKYLMKFQVNPLANNTPKLALRRIDKNKMEKIKRKCKEYGATVNDALCAAFFRTTLKEDVFLKPGTENRGAITVTVDLRRYLPKQTTGSICNFSGSEVLAIDLQAGEPFEATLMKVKTGMDKIKSKRPGVSSAAYMELIARGPLSEAREIILKQKESLSPGVNPVMPYLSNMGVISEAGLRFGKGEAFDGYLVAPINYAPFFCLGASTYKGTLTLSFGYYVPAFSETDVDRFMDGMAGELEGV